MSHVPQRKEKDCLNCGAIVQGRYCQVCGQENVEPRESFWHMVTHFFYDITHFDSRFFETVKDLVLRPGFLSREYIKGKRASYLHPVRMYVFTSAIFFLVFFSFFNGSIIKSSLDQSISATERKNYIEKLKEKLNKNADNLLLKQKLLYAEDSTHSLLVKDTLNAENGGVRVSLGDSKYKSYQEYDSVQKSLPNDQRDGWFIRRLTKKSIDLNTRFHDNPDEAMKELGESVLHRLPYMLFISLPLFALLLRFVYIRRKQFYYMDHGIFTIHIYVFSFLLLLAVFGMDALMKATGFGFIGFIIAALYIGLFFYLYKAMRNFYGQKRWKTFIKFLIVVFFSFVMMLVLFMSILFFSAVTF